MSTLATGTTLAQRSLAPDLARGAMLLIIALANVHFFLYGFEPGIRNYPGAPDALDRLVIVLQMCLVDGRAYPMFAALFGYGLVQMTRRFQDSGLPLSDQRKLLRRRGFWMLVIGFLHALFLFSGDIIGAYGLLAALLGGMVLRASNRTLIIVAGVWLIPTVFMGGAAGAPAGTEDAKLSFNEAQFMTAAVFRVTEWIIATPLQAILLLPTAFLLGVWAGRRRFLDEPEKHQRLLRRVAVGGIGIAVIGGFPAGMVAAQNWDLFPWNGAAGAVHAVSGFAGAFGYAAAIACWAVALQGKTGGWFSTALAACGQRSMTCYLWQSVVFVAVLASYGGGLGDQFSTSQAALLAIATWVSGLGLAEVMRRRGHRGPGEVFLRRMTYAGHR